MTDKIIFYSGDSFAPSNNMYFSTVDADNDKGGGSCAGAYKSGWWFNYCLHANLNGEYRKPPKKNDSTSLSWYTWGNMWMSLKSAKMMIRPR